MLNKPTPRIARIFSAPYEEINLLFGIGLLILALGEIAWGQELSAPTRIFFYFGTMIFIGASGHIGFTLSLLIMLPEAREWIRIKTQQRPWWFWTKAGGVFAGTFIAAVVAFDLLTIAGVGAINIAYIFLLADWFFVIHHSVAQSHGLMIAYNRQLLKEGVAIPPPSTEARNKYITVVFIFCAFATPVLYSLSLDASTIQKGNYALFGISLFALLLYASQSFRPWSAVRRNQLLFGLRWLLFPLMSLSYFAGIGYRGVHSVEYIMVYKKFFQHSKHRVSPGLVVGVSVTLFLGFTLLGFFSMAKDSDFLISLLKPSGSQTEWFKFLAALNAACTFSHYYLDRIIFRMRDGDSRRIFGSLLSA